MRIAAEVCRAVERMAHEHAATLLSATRLNGSEGATHAFRLADVVAVGAPGNRRPNRDRATGNRELHPSRPQSLTPVDFRRHSLRKRLYSSGQPTEGHDSFHTTHWSIVFSAQDTQDPQAADALEQLCRGYWRPLYAYVRRLGNDPDTAQALTQAFFERLLENKGLKAADPDKGRFRSFLLASLKNFLANEWDRRTAVKRGGRYQFISLQAAGAEAEFQSDARRELPPDLIYERRWALAVLEQARQRLEADYRARGKHAVFIGLSAHLAGDSEASSYAAAADSLGLTAEAARKAVTAPPAPARGGSHASPPVSADVGMNYAYYEGTSCRPEVRSDRSMIETASLGQLADADGR